MRFPSSAWFCELPEIGRGVLSAMAYYRQLTESAYSETLMRCFVKEGAISQLLSGFSG
jgi:hypothetical protein